MPLKLDSRNANFSESFKRLLQSRSSGDKTISARVEAIIEDVRIRGDAALIGYTKQFDRWDAEVLAVTQEEIRQAVAHASPELMKSLEVAAGRIIAYSKRQLPEDALWEDEAGVTLGWKWTPLDAVGLYVPGGLASYPSSVLMNAMLARAAGVKRIVMVVPTPDGKLNPAVLAAAHIAGITEIYKIGGAQAVAALAFGTENILPVDKIVGPGNAYVAEAKRQVFGAVGIDMIAGPSEILVVADGKNDPQWIVADLLSQAEHDELAQSILITDNVEFAEKVEHALEEILRTLPRAAIMEKSWNDHGVVITVASLEEAVPLVNALAPEHLELAVERPEAMAAHIRHAGAIFLGRHTPEAIGDYIAGPSHVLPTSRTARFASGLSVLDFLKRSSIIGCSVQACKELSCYGVMLAEAEGLHAHQLSMAIRNKI